MYADLGVIDMNTWYKLKVKAHGNAFDFYFDDAYQGTASDGTWASGAVGLLGRSELLHSSTISGYQICRI